MATNTEQHVKTEVEQDAKKGAKSLKGFFNKFNNDWVMNFASALAFNLITAILPILIAILGVTGLIVGHLDPTAETQLVQHIQQIFPSSGTSGTSGTSGGAFVQLALTQLNKSAGILVIIAVLLAIFGGSRLFISMEGYFDIIYHVRPRNVIKQNIMAIIMMVVFIVLTILMVFAASIPAAIQSIGHIIGLGPLVSNGFVTWLVSITISLFVAWILFEAIFVVVPNQHISFRNSWLGALVAAVLLDIYLQLFPLYVTHFLGNYTGQIGLAVVLLFFLYYFAVILLIGAEINAYFAEGIQVTPDNLAVMVHNLTSHMTTSLKDIQEQAAPSHKGVQPKVIVPKSAADQQQTQAGQTPNRVQLEQTASIDHTRSVAHRAKKRGPVDAASGTPKALAIGEVIAGTALVFIIQFFQIRRK